VLRTARTRGHTPRRERAVRAFSHLGEHGALWLVPGVLGGRWRRAAGTVALAYVVNQLIKRAVPRRRPELDGLPPLIRTRSRRTFPSAHAATSFAGARSYARLGVPAAPLYALATAMAASRVWLGVHHPSDVLAGAALGTLIAR
jgi:undecaprenyl-diphosphatase